MDKGLIAIIVTSEIASLFLIFKVVKSSAKPLTKFLISLMLSVPILGPIFYLFGFEAPPLNKYMFRRHKSRSIGSYENDFEVQSARYKSYIEKLERRIEETDDLKEKP